MITIYGTETCVYCVKSKRLCEDYNLNYEWKDTEESETLSHVKSLLPDMKTIPQIWWNEKHIGGYTEFASEIENTMNAYGDGRL